MSVVDGETVEEAAVGGNGVGAGVGTAEGNWVRNGSGATGGVAVGSGMSIVVGETRAEGEAGTATGIVDDVVLGVRVGDRIGTGNRKPEGVVLVICVGR